MGKCCKCFSIFPPQYMRELEGVEEEVYQCVYCKLGKDYVMVLMEDGKEIKYMKSSCIKDYKMFLRQLKETPNIAEKLAKNKIKIE